MNAPVHHRNGGFQIRELCASTHPRGPHVKTDSHVPHAQGKLFTGLLLLGAGLGPQLKV